MPEPKEAPKVDPDSRTCHYPPDVIEILPDFQVRKPTQKEIELRDKANPYEVKLGN